MHIQNKILLGDVSLMSLLFVSACGRLPDNSQKVASYVIANSKQVVFDSEPYAGFWKKLSVNLMRILPVDSML